MDVEICKKCRYYGGVHANSSNWIFGGCAFPPYKRKFIAEIEKCPKTKCDVGENDYCGQGERRNQ